MPMRRVFKPFQHVPAWILIPIALLMVGGIGYVDYITGDYSMLIFYAIPISIVAWVVGDWGVTLVSAAAGGARYFSDYFSYADNNLRYWNTIEDFLFLLIVGLLISNIRRILEEEKNDREQGK
ncbi:hypothetical protein [Geomesophilobacter sediminis]|uniref:Uncharacterized protein n=1 Tax=Geomesophilobacter sediminis TaxID=2798584 RepID=A0A8J7IN35_9BACT|nr:hypothetical protein [Geomesophilobacter sediminis]MBJ6724458.1 hypothetical protein [Geomesophilobacter sediminis]